MNTIPIAFAFDKNLIFPACIAISSLLENAVESTFYDIFILYPENDRIDFSQFERLHEKYDNYRMTFKGVGQVFEASYIIRGITTPAYYRLIIPELIPEYDKVIYSDVDVIFRMDLTQLYEMDLGENYLAATRALGMNISSDGRNYIASVPGLRLGDYLQSGFIVINSSFIRKDGLVKMFIEAARRDYKFQDQDILNVVCGNRVVFISPQYNMTDLTFYYFTCNRSALGDLCEGVDMGKCLSEGTIHFNGAKPWRSYCPNMDIWWEYYRKSVYFDPQFYFNFYYSKLDELDRLPLLKRLKILGRYFIYGRKK